MARSRSQQLLFDFTAKPEQPQEGNQQNGAESAPAVGPLDDDIFGTTAGPLFRQARKPEPVAEQESPAAPPPRLKAALAAIPEIG